MNRNYFDLTGQVAIVTGASGGLGVQMAKALASQGCNIVVMARRQQQIDEVAAQIAEEFGVETLAIRCDITDTDNVNAAVAQVLEHFGRIDILINNAGTGAVAPAEDITDDQFNGEMQIDLFGTFKVARACAKQAMIPAKYGRIINIASMYGLVGNKVAGSAPYHAAKGGVVNLTQVRHHRQLHLPGLLLHPAHARDARQRLLPGQRQDHDSRGALRQRGRARHRGHLPGQPGELLRHGRAAARRRRIHVHVRVRA